MAGKTKKWLIGCGIGCGILIIVPILLTVGLSLYFSRPFDDAADTQEALEAKFGSSEEFVPPGEGITPARMEIFLTVREAVIGSCEKFESAGRAFESVEDLDEVEDPDKSEILQTVLDVVGAGFGVGSEMAALINNRNTALLENEMSLGEYTWIYILAYYSWLEYVPNISFDDGEGEITSTTFQLMLEMMENHAESLAHAELLDDAALWRDEIGHLKRTADSAPFAAGDVPYELVTSFAPFRLELEQLFCPSMDTFELQVIDKNGLNIQVN